MHSTLATIQEQLRKLAAQVMSSLPNDEPLSVAHGNWSFPGLTRVELAEAALEIATAIEQQGGDDINGVDARLLDYVRRLQFLQTNTVQNMWGNAGQGVPAYMLTLEGLKASLRPALNSNSQAETSAKLRQLQSQLRGMESRLKSLEPRTGSLAEMVERIERAHTAADQLPTDLESLAEAQRQVGDLAQSAAKDQARIAGFMDDAEKLVGALDESRANAESVLERCETAYSAATSVGLAAAFTERSEALSRSMWVWVVGLVAALITGGYFGSHQLQSFAQILWERDARIDVLILHLVLAVLSVGAPIWFGWLATKQIGQRFRLAEDYAFKAAVSRAYDGFRREAARVDKAMEAKLLAAAIARLDELPLRLVEAESHGSPWHELASSDAVKEALKSVPAFPAQVKELAVKGMEALRPVQRPASKLAREAEAPADVKA